MSDDPGPVDDDVTSMTFKQHWQLVGCALKCRQFRWAIHYAWTSIPEGTGWMNVLGLTWALTVLTLNVGVAFHLI